MGPPLDPTCRPTEGSYGGVVSYERGDPVQPQKDSPLIGYPLGGDGVKFYPKEVLGRFCGPTVRRTRLLATQSRCFERPGLNHGHLKIIKWPEILSFSLGPKSTDPPPPPFRLEPEKQIQKQSGLRCPIVQVIWFRPLKKTA